MGVRYLGRDIKEEVEYIEDHIHRYSKCFGQSADQSGNDWSLENSLTPFQAISGNADFGSDTNDEAKIFGTDDTPFISGQTKFDIDGILVVDVSHDTEYILRFVWHDTDMASGISAGQVTTTMIKFDSTNPQLSAGVPIEFGCKKINIDDKVWCQCKNATDNATIDFYVVGSHGY